MEQGGVGAELGQVSEEFVFRAGLDVLYRENTFTHVRIKVEEAASSPPSRLTLY